MLREDGGEGWWHVLDDEHRRFIDHAIELGDDRIERLRPAGRRTDQKNTWRNRREGTQLDGAFAVRSVFNAHRRHRLVRRHHERPHDGRRRGWRRLTRLLRRFLAAYSERANFFHAIWAIASRPLRSAATTSRPGSDSTQRAIRPRTTTASSTTMTRMVRCAVAECKVGREAAMMVIRTR